MVILDCTWGDMMEAMERIIVNPNRQHMREDAATNGGDRSIDDILRQSVTSSRIVSCRNFGDGMAYIGGIGDDAPWTNDLLVKQMWLFGTEGIEECPAKTLRAGRSLMKTALKVYGFPYCFEQLIPLDYRQGVDFARDGMGFDLVDEVTGRDGTTLGRFRKALI